MGLALLGLKEENDVEPPNGGEDSHGGAFLLLNSGLGC